MFCYTYSHDIGGKLDIVGPFKTREDAENDLPEGLRSLVVVREMLIPHKSSFPAQQAKTVADLSSAKKPRKSRKSRKKAEAVDKKPKVQPVG